MARTKKQTIAAASARKRQFQEGILKESLEMKPKKEKIDSSHSETTSCVKCDNVKITPSHQDLLKGNSSTVPSCSQSTDESGILPQAVVHVTDICKTSPRNMEEKSVKKSTDCSPVRRRSSSGSRQKNLFEEIQSMETTPKTRRKDLSQTNMNVKQERKSSRQKSPSQTGLSSAKSSKSPDPSLEPEKPKVNIFTDNMGKDLGKRTRSPRRMSSDMIALPIVSYRKAVQSPKDSTEPSKCEDDSQMEATFKSPTTSPLLSKKSSPGRLSTRKSPSMDSGLDVKKKLKNMNSIEPTPSKPEPTKSRYQLRDGGTLSESTQNDNDLSMSLICKKIVGQITSSRRDIFIRSIKDTSKADKEDPIGDTEDPLSNRKGQIIDKRLMKVPKDDEDGKGDIEDSKVDKRLKKFPKDDEDGRGDTEDLKRNEGDSKISKPDDHGDEKGDETVPKSDEDNAKCNEQCPKGEEDVKGDWEIKKSTLNEISKTPEKRDVSAVNDKDKKNTAVDGNNEYLNDPSRNESEEICVRPVEEEKLVDEKQVAEEETSLNKDSDDESEEKSSLLCAMLVGGVDVAESYSQERERYNPEVTQISDSETEQLAVRCPSPISFVPKNVKTEPMDEEPVQSNSTSIDAEKDISDVKCAENNKETIDVVLKQIKSDRKKGKGIKKSLDLAFQLKKVNDHILKLLDLDVEDQFLNVPDVEEIIRESKSENVETELYKLISSLGDRLKKTNTDSSGEIDEIVQSCPKGPAPVVSASFCDKKWRSILDRLEVERCRAAKTQRKLMREKLIVDMEHLVEKMSSSTLFSGNDEDDKPSNSDSKAASSCCPPPPPVNVASDKNKESSDDSIKGSFLPGNIKEGIQSASSPSLNGSLCELDLDDLTKAATQIMKIPDSPLKSETLTGTLEKNEGAESTSLTVKAIKRTFQKSKTCSDFALETSSSSKSAPLLRSNSSPSLKIDCLSQTLSSESNLGKEQVKSKLGGKIPVPGTSYPAKSTKKVWRKPRLIEDPKPLDVLLQFVRDEKEGFENVFSSLELQKYLWMPSNRMIVKPEIQNEMKIADKTAQDAWEKKLQLMADEEERQRQKEEEINSKYVKYKPDFDEVDGMLFMSFSSEVELLAHVRVEKALEWDKDNTMLRISRARAFEETKALNGDMNGVKMKKLRGQHMRLKKYRRMYSNEVEGIIEARSKNIPLEEIRMRKKTSDLSKVKRTKKRSSLVKAVQKTPEKTIENNEISAPTPNETPQCIPSAFSSEDFTEQQEQIMDEAYKRSLSPKSRRRFNFSDQSAHKKLFKELGMDWEDRMIHKKLGGWSLKGNRPKQFSQAAKKRELKEMKENTPEDSFKVRASKSDSPHDASSTPVCRKRKLIFPLVTEKIAKGALRTLELSDDLRQAAKRNKKRKHSQHWTMVSDKELPSLTPIFSPTANLAPTPSSSQATAGSSVKTEPSTPDQASTSSGMMTPQPLSLELPEETVEEGVDDAYQTSSPVSEAHSSPQIKTCSKPGCRYGCICHLCSVNDLQSSLQSPVTKPSTRICNKEYCRLGCICDSLDPEQPVSTQVHCGKPSCMLGCNCSTPGSGEGNEEIPFLSAMKQRPRAGERFLNLPRREKTHRTAKNLDAVTRKAMMLYETSEIYCERNERPTKKKSESGSASLPSTSFGYDSSFALEQQSLLVGALSGNNLSDCYIDYEEPRIIDPVAIDSPASERSKLFPWMLKRPQEEVDEFNLDEEIRPTHTIVEPSAHKRKRKSHPLSDEIFTISTCARIQPYSAKKRKTAGSVFDHTQVSKQYTPASIVSAGEDVSANSFSGQNVGELNLKISGVCSLADEGNVIDLSSSPQLREETQEIEKNSSSYLSKTTTCTGEHEKSQETPRILSKCVETTTITNDSEPDHHGWHTSMVCLKAKAPPVASTGGEEDDVQEEDEVKLLEFAANCSWERSKKDILGRVASCLTRNQYPAPRTMNVHDFVVEILPKAKQPSMIPSALRTKLPDQMYSIRVRITKNDDIRNEPAVIDLSSPKKKVKENQLSENACITTKNSNHDLTSSAPVSSFVHMPLVCSSSFSSSNTFTSTISVKPPHVSPSMTVATSSTPVTTPFSSSSLLSNVKPSIQNSIGISGLSKMLTNSNNPPTVYPVTTHLKSGPVKDQSSLDSMKDSLAQKTGNDSNASVITTKVLPSPIVMTATRTASGGLTKHSLLSKPITYIINSNGKRIILPLLTTIPDLSVSKNSDPITATAKTFSIPKKIVPATSLLVPGRIVATSSKDKTSLAVQNTPVVTSEPATSSVTTHSQPGNELQYVEMVYKMDGLKDKKASVIMPVSMQNSTGDTNDCVSSKPILTVSLPGAHVKGLPLLAPRTKSKLPQTVQGTSLLKVVGTTSQSEACNGKPVTISMQVIPPPSSVISNVVVDTMTVNSSSSFHTNSQNSPKSCEEVSSPLLTNSNCDEAMTVTSSSVCVTPSRERPISSSEVSVQPVSVDNSSTETSCKSIKSLVNNDLPQSIPSDDTNKERMTEEKQMFGKESILMPCKGVTCPESNIMEVSQTQEYIPKHSPVKIVLDELPNEVLSSKSNENECLSSSQSVVGKEEQKSESGEADQGNSHEQNEIHQETASSSPLISETYTVTVQSNPKEGEEQDDGSQCQLADNFEVIDMGDLLTFSTADSLMMGECVDVCSDIPTNPQAGVEAVVSDVKISTSSNGLAEFEEQAAKMSKGYSDFPLPMDEDSQLSYVPSPHSLTSKSLLSSAVSSESNEDVVVAISSDEEIDVGEYDMNFQDRVEKAWENDHSSMFQRMPETIKGNSVHCHPKKESIVRGHGEHHNFLERSRRAKLKELFDNLGDLIVSVKESTFAYTKGGAGNEMSKARILNEARLVIHELEKRDRAGEEELKQLKEANKILLNHVKELTGPLSEYSVSTGSAFANLLTGASEKTSPNVSVETFIPTQPSLSATSAMPYEMFSTSDFYSSSEINEEFPEDVKGKSSFFDEYGESSSTDFLEKELNCEDDLPITFSYDPPTM